MNLGNQVEWALHCMSVLSWMPDGISVPAKVLAEFHGVPKDYLSKSLQLLSNEGLLKTTSGPKGGYQLARKASEISLLDIVEAVEGRKNTFNCQEIRFNNPCMGNTAKKTKSICGIASAMYSADKAWRDILRKKKISDIVSEYQASASEKDMKKDYDWFIERCS